MAADLPRADQWLKSVRSELDSTGQNLHPGWYFLRWGTCELCGLTVLERQFGDQARAQQHEKLLLEMFSTLEANGNRVHAHDYFLATLDVSRGEHDAGLAKLERAVDRGWRRAWLIRIDPALAGVRDTPRFRTLLEKIDSANAKTRDQMAAGRKSEAG
jgi:hypothetical protein